MTKTELIASVAEKTGLTKKDSEAGVNALFNTITSALAAGDSVQLIGFGTFETKQRGEREAVNPRNREEKIVVPAATVPAFRAGKQLKEAVKG